MHMATNAERPDVAADTPAPLANLIRCCWKQVLKELQSRRKLPMQDVEDAIFACGIIILLMIVGAK